jgi:hypothetical protein
MEYDDKIRSMVGVDVTDYLDEQTVKVRTQVEVGSMAAFDSEGKPLMLETECEVVVFEHGNIRLGFEDYGTFFDWVERQSGGKLTTEGHDPGEYVAHLDTLIVVGIPLLEVWYGESDSLSLKEVAECSDKARMYITNLFRQEIGEVRLWLIG